MNKKALIFKYFQKKDQLTVKNGEYQKAISSLFLWLIDNDKVRDDKTTRFFPNKDAKAIIIAKQDGIIAGLEEVGYLLEKHTKLVFNPKTKDGSGITNKETIAQIRGRSHDILAYERTILNILQRMSGIATETNQIINRINQRLFIAATRKTPWMSLDKKAVAVGRGLTHRLNLSDGILVKDNHLANSSIEDILKFILGKIENNLAEIEVETENQAITAIKTFQQLSTNNQKLITNHHLAILLDNFSPSAAQKLLSNLNNSYDLSEIIFEASGGIDQNNILEWSKTGVDIISLGALTHSAQAANLSLEFV